jgi:hypothetical protein
VVVDVGLTVVLPDAASFVLKFVPVQEDEDGVSVPDITSAALTVVPFEVKNKTPAKLKTTAIKMKVVRNFLYVYICFIFYLLLRASCWSVNSSWNRRN